MYAVCVTLSPDMVWDDVHYLLHKILPLVPILNHINLAYALPYHDEEVVSAYFSVLYQNHVGRHSSVGIATRYEVDCPEIESRWGAGFSAPVQTVPWGPTQYAMQWLTGLSRG
jgi:hypothetical protein